MFILKKKDKREKIHLGSLQLCVEEKEVCDNQYNHVDIDIS